MFKVFKQKMKEEWVKYEFTEFCVCCISILQHYNAVNTAQ